MDDASKFKGDADFTAKLLARTAECAPALAEKPVAARPVQPNVPQLFDDVPGAPVGAPPGVEPAGLVDGCQSDFDCKGNRVCDRHRCTEPP